MQGIEQYYGVDIGGSKVFVGVYSSTGDLLDFRRYPTPSEGRDTLIEILSTAIGELAFPQMQAVGISCAGHVDYRTGQIIQTPHIRGIDGFSIGDALSQRTGLPVYLENDARMFAFAESEAGSARDQESMLGLIVGSGVGLGIVPQKGVLLRGHSCGAGEIGHTVLDLSTDRTVEHCLVQDAAAFMRREDGTHYTVGDLRSQKPQELESWIQALTTLLRNLSLSYDPEVIVIGGGIGVNIVTPLLPELRQSLRMSLQKAGMPRPVLLRPASLPDPSGAYGAALFARGQHSSS